MPGPGIHRDHSARPAAALAAVAALAAIAGSCFAGPEREAVPAGNDAAEPAVARGLPVVPLNTNFWSYWTHYWTTWLPDHPVYEMIELTAYENPSDPEDVLVRAFLTEREGRKQQYFYLNDEAEVARTRANAFFRDIAYRRSGPDGGPQNLYVEFTDKDGIAIAWTITFPPGARLRDHGSGLTPSIHSVGGLLLFALRTRTADTHDDRVLFDGTDYASRGPADDATARSRSWHNPDYYSAILLFGRLQFTHHDGVLSNSWGRTFAPLPDDPLTFRTGDLGPENFAQFVLDPAGAMASYSHFSRGHSLDFAFDPPIRAVAAAETVTRIRFGASFDNRRPLMAGSIRIHRVAPDVVVLEWVPSEPEWAVGRDFWSVIRFGDSGYELTLTDDRRAIPAPQ